MRWPAGKNTSRTRESACARLISARRVGAAALTALGWIALFVAPMACAGAHDQVQEKLYDATKDYHRHLRWKDYDRAAEFLPPESSEGFLAQYDEIRDDIAIVDAQLMRLHWDRGKGTANARFEIEWHDLTKMVVYRTTVDEVWQWYEGTWFLVEQVRVSGHKLSVIAEPPEQPEKPKTSTMATLPGLEEFRTSRKIGEIDKHGKPKKKAHDD